jgi:alkylation response protein AidB-like acyl-CoA dehydrogenase
MDFALSEALTLLRDMARDFAENALIPRAERHDREAEIDPVVWEKLGELGLLGLVVPEEYGGAGLPNLALAIVLEELNRGCAATGVTVSVHNSLGCSPIVKYGTEEQKREWLPKLATGEVLGAYALTEPGAGSDAAALSTRAVRDGDGWVLDGTKIWVTTGSLAGLFCVYACTDPDVPKGKGISAFLVPRDAPGLRIGKREKKVGIRGSPAVELILEGCRVGPDAVLGTVDRGFPIALDMLDGGRIGIGAQAIGIGVACIEEAVKYAKEREQFGRPIAEFQAIQWKIADMQARIDAARLMVRHAAWMRDQGQRCSQQAAEAKLLASTACNFAADECLQIHGGAGYTDHFPVERLFRDARITEIYEGATDIQRLVIARHVLA